MRKDFLWAELYRPSKVRDCILDADIKKIFQNFVDQGSIPNLLLSGPTGVGKTTIAMAMCEELDIDYLKINASLDGGIDTLRNEILQFASSVSFSGKRKCVILDEADRMTTAFQEASRSFFDEFSKNCSFILTANNKRAIIDPIKGRLSEIDFSITKSNLPVLMKEFRIRLIQILNENKITYDKSVVNEVIIKFAPNWRKIFHELQKYNNKEGVIDTGALSFSKDVTITDAIGYMKKKNYTELRKWVAENIGSDQNIIYRKIYDHCSQYVDKESIPVIILILAKYQFQASFAIDPEINLMAALTEIMVESTFL